MTYRETKEWIETTARLHKYISVRPEPIFSLDADFVVRAFADLEIAVILQSSGIADMSPAYRLLAMLMTNCVYQGFTPMAMMDKEDRANG